MTDKVQADYGTLAQFSNRFGNQEQETVQVLQVLHSSLDKLENGGWIGHGSDAFFSTMHSTVLPALQRLQQALVDVNQMTKQLTQDFRNAEGEASAGFGSK